MLIEKLKEKIIEKHEGRQRQKPEPGVIWASEIGKCPRYLWYAVRGTPFSDEVGKEAYQKFEEGIFHEERIVQEIASIEDFQILDKQKPLDWELEGWKIHGKIDVVLYDKKEGVYVVEIKALSRWGARSFVKNPESRIDYLWQGFIYAAWLNADLLFLVRDRDSGDLYELHYPPADVVGCFQNEILPTLRALHDNEPPPQKPRMSWECRYCRYRSLCNPQPEPRKFVLDQGINALLLEYVEIQKEMRNLENRKKEIAEQVKAFMKTEGLSKYYWGDIHAQLQVRRSRYLKKEWKSKLPGEAFEIRESESLIIKAKE